MNRLIILITSLTIIVAIVVATNNQEPIFHCDSKLLLSRLRNEVNNTLLVGVVDFASEINYEDSLIRALYVAVETLGFGTIKYSVCSFEDIKFVGPNLHINSLLIFDSLQYTLIPNEIWDSTKPRVFREWLDKRYANPQVDFTASLVPLELRWAHARGNFKLVKCGYIDNTYPSSSVITQYSKPGHLFAGVTGKHLDHDFPLDHVVSLYLVPAMTGGAGFRHSVDLSKLTCSENGCRADLLQYWREQRASQMFVQSWALQRLSNEPYMFLELPQQLLAGLSSEYLKNRNTVSAVVEPLISTVFNQLETNTFYIPVLPERMDELSGYILQEVSNWLGRDDLEVTGAYGIREYRRNAVIDFHVDPAHTQPITAVLHVSHSKQSQVCSDKATATTCSFSSDSDSDSDSDSESNWAFEVDERGFNSSSGLRRFYLREGEAIVFHSALLPHGRREPLGLEWYGNVFIHIAPHNWESYVDELL